MDNERWRLGANMNPSARLRAARSMPPWVQARGGAVAPPPPPPLQVEQPIEPDYEVIEFSNQTYSNTNVQERCDLCGSSSTAVRCMQCSHNFCMSCDEMYHRHPKRQAHIRMELNGKQTTTSTRPIRPPLPPKGEAAPAPVPPPRRNKRFTNTPPIPPSPIMEQRNQKVGLVGSLKRMVGNRPLPSAPFQNGSQGPSQHIQQVPQHITQHMPQHIPQQMPHHVQPTIADFNRNPEWEMKSFQRSNSINNIHGPGFNQMMQAHSLAQLNCPSCNHQPVMWDPWQNTMNASPWGIPPTGTWQSAAFLSRRNSQERRGSLRRKPKVSSSGSEEEERFSRRRRASPAMSRRGQRSDYESDDEGEDDRRWKKLPETRSLSRRASMADGINRRNRDDDTRSVHGDRRLSQNIIKNSHDISNRLKSDSQDFKNKSDLETTSNSSHKFDKNANEFKDQRRYQANESLSAYCSRENSDFEDLGPTKTATKIIQPQVIPHQEYKQQKETSEQNDSEEEPIPLPLTEWQCKHCTYLNQPGTRVCEVCCKTATQPKMRKNGLSESFANLSVEPKRPLRNSSTASVSTSTSATSTSFKGKNNSTEVQTTRNFSSKGTSPPPQNISTQIYEAPERKLKRASSLSEYDWKPPQRSYSRQSLLSETQNSKRAGSQPPDYLSTLVQKQVKQGLEMVKLLREAEEHKFSADDLGVALLHCEDGDPILWLQQNWRNMIDTVVTLGTNYGHERKENTVGTISASEARDALRMHDGNVWAAVTECVEQRQKKYAELLSRGNFSREDIVTVLTANHGNLEAAFTELSKSQLKPFLMRIWGPPQGADNDSGDFTKLAHDNEREGRGGKQDDEVSLIFPNDNKERIQSWLENYVHKSKTSQSMVQLNSISSKTSETSEWQDYSFHSSSIGRRRYSDVHRYLTQYYEANNSLQIHIRNQSDQNKNENVQSDTNKNGSIPSDSNRDENYTESKESVSNESFKESRASSIAENISIAEEMPDNADVFENIRNQESSESWESIETEERISDFEEIDSQENHNEDGSNKIETDELMASTLSLGKIKKDETNENDKIIVNEINEIHRIKNELDYSLQSEEPKITVVHIPQSKSLNTPLSQISEANSELDVSSIPTDSEKDSTGVTPNLLNFLKERFSKEDVVESLVNTLFQTVLKASVDLQNLQLLGSHKASKPKVPEEDSSDCTFFETEDRNLSDLNGLEVEDLSAKLENNQMDFKQEVQHDRTPDVQGSAQTNDSIFQPQMETPNNDSYANQTVQHEHIGNQEATMDTQLVQQVVPEAQVSQPYNSMVQQQIDQSVEVTAVEELQDKAKANVNNSVIQESIIHTAETETNNIDTENTNKLQNLVLETEAIEEANIDLSLQQDINKTLTTPNSNIEDFENQTITAQVIIQPMEPAKKVPSETIEAEERTVKEPLQAQVFIQSTTSPTEDDKNEIIENINENEVSESKEIKELKPKLDSETEDDKKEITQNINEHEVSESKEMKELKPKLDSETEDDKKEITQNINENEVSESKEMKELKPKFESETLGHTNSEQKQIKCDSIIRHVQSESSNEQNKTELKITKEDPKIQGEVMPISVASQSVKNAKNKSKLKKTVVAKNNCETIPLEIKKDEVTNNIQIIEMDVKQREVRRMLAEGFVKTYDEAELAVRLLEMNFNEEESISAATECTNLDMALTFLQQECFLCAGKYTMKQDCAKNYFTLQITERTINDCVCPFCKEPNLGRMGEDQASLYFSHLDILLKAIVKDTVHELFQRKLRDRTLMQDPNFKWCIKCSSGFIANPRQKRLMCPDCKTITCASCARSWEKQHEKMTCDEFAAWLESNDPENQLEHHLKENGVKCPKCQSRYVLAKGGCMHLTCPQCKHEFCSGCARPFLMGNNCTVSKFCEKLGLHSHHPRNCLFYLRDKEPDSLQKLLEENGVQYRKENEEGIFKCRTQLLKETPDGFLEGICGLPIEGASLCRTHYIERLTDLIRNNNIDPVSIMSLGEAQQELRRHGKDPPTRASFSSDFEYLGGCIKVIKEHIPLD